MKKKKQEMKKGRDVLTKEKDILNKLNLTADMEATERKQGRKRANPPEHSTPRRITRPRYL